MIVFSSIRTGRDVFVFAAKLAFLVFLLVAAATMLSYPREEWVEEVGLHGGIAATLAFGMTFKLGLLIRRNNRFSEELQARADCDPLTNSATRRAFFERLRAQPGLSGAALMVDIDHFKQVNDTHGHFVGDQVIQKVAGVLQGKVRSSDVVCRFGGEEFAVFLKDVTPETAFHIAERMRQEVADGAFEINGQSLELSISLGLSRKEPEEDIDAALARADAALYRAKAGGRNRVVMNWPTGIVPTKLGIAV